MTIELEPDELSWPAVRLPSDQDAIDFVERFDPDNHCTASRSWLTDLTMRCDANDHRSVPCFAMGGDRNIKSSYIISFPTPTLYKLLPILCALDELGA